MKIINPFTNRSIDASGETARNLYKNHPYILEPSSGHSKASPFIKLSEFQDISPIDTKGTSQLFTGTCKKQKYYLKNVVKEGNSTNNVIELVTNEFLASVIYTQVYKVPAIKLFIVINDITPKPKSYQKFMVASHAIEIDTCEPISRDCKKLIENKIPGAIEPFLVDCILANWDVGSRGNVGIITDKKTNKKQAFRIDVGGSLLYRAMGQPRNFTPVPTEHTTFFQPSNKGHKLFINMTKSQIPVIMKPIRAIPETSPIFDNLEANLSQVFASYPKALKIIKTAIPIVKKRHEYYFSNPWIPKNLT
jgi:hypothetical protein